MNKGLLKYGYMPISFIYYEIIFALFIGSEHVASAYVCAFLFAVATGFLIDAIAAIIPNSKVRNALNIIVLLATAILFGVVYFVHAQFQVFYDIVTVFNGAGGATTQFAGDIKLLLLSPTGLFIIFLLLLPIILYIVIMIISAKKQKDIVNKKNSVTTIVVLVATFVLFISFYHMMIEADDNLYHVYTDEYSYERAINTFGLLTATKLDVTGMTGTRSVSETGFEMVDVPVVAVETEDNNNQSQTSGGSISDNAVSGDSASLSDNDIEEEVPAIIEYGRNELDIDFEALAENATGDVYNVDMYLAGLTGSSQNEYTGLFEGKNLVLITAEAFSAEAIDEERTPTLYRMANKGIQFTDYYQPSSAGTTGGEYAVLMGMLPSNGGGSMPTASENLNYMTMGYQLNNLGYYGRMYHNNDYKYYNRHITHNTLGYSDGYMGYGNGMEQFVPAGWPESDVAMIEGTISEFIDNQPFNVYYMTVSGHSLYGFNCNAMSVKHRESIEGLDYTEPVLAYLACQVELDEAMEILIDALEEKGIADDTVIVISADHFPYGLDSTSNPVGMPYLTELYGQPISDNLYRDHNRLIIWSGCLEDMDPIVVDDPVFSPDITPTLLNLFGVEFDSRLLPGRDVFSDAQPLVYDLGYDWKTDLGTYLAGRNEFIPVSEDIEIPDGYVESIKSLVRNKIMFSSVVLFNDYYRHVFPDAQLVNTIPNGSSMIDMTGRTVTQGLTYGPDDDTPRMHQPAATTEETVVEENVAEPQQQVTEGNTEAVIEQ